MSSNYKKSIKLTLQVYRNWQFEWTTKPPIFLNRLYDWTLNGLDRALTSPYLVLLNYRGECTVISLNDGRFLHEHVPLPIYPAGFHRLEVIIHDGEPCLVAPSSASRHGPQPKGIIHLIKLRSLKIVKEVHVRLPAACTATRDSNIVFFALQEGTTSYLSTIFILEYDFFPLHLQLCDNDHVF